MDYWKCCIEESFEDAGITATKEQISTVVEWVEGAFENYGLATGNDVASQNLAASKRDEIEKAERELERERNKVHCTNCDGTGRSVTSWGSSGRSADSQCVKCRGNGRHDP